ncbi:helix-turn-helix domain-containing protein [Aquimarina sp. U1-2]|uniref:helix-turn-helix domain-containing protein n=1 Tax=Aquimarina sp. U1-2 TaxID=2823141 RepID=UPI001AECE11E|nr:helix-turn-helix domain-containing protein [Aquimarina sp. U1-2]MBP2831067.1 helix-turn-helix domain-containing protein [Aquimarina sp. U1-2]
MSKKDIPVFETSNDLHTFTGYEHRTHISDFDIFTLESLEPTCRRCMPPYRQNFYQIGILSYTGISEINLNTNAVKLDQSPLWFVVPGQVFSWVRDPKIAGYHIQFKREFIDDSVGHLTREFPFLKVEENSVFLLTQEEQLHLQNDMKHIHTVFQAPHPYQEKMLQNMLLGMLYFCKSIYERHKTVESTLSRGQALTQNFQQLVDKFYVDTKNVGDYADKLNVTPNYLTTVVKKVTGKSAKDLIHNRLLLESKNMLSFTDMDVAEIAFQLNFQEPTHFTRFFKKLSGTTPNKFRQAQ